ncbi:SCP2 sterol-binding domain-containing protein [Amphritea atlantica]|uniref:SCP2 sterol-binding domain-containing protein n=1 Tax=Amphritea atlantica TaxID=355243 RepID=A0ABY5GZN0_9GAMM|nr:SCP2 sterol-binding domain-containing protein [Amphritea atlantica]
MSAIQGLFDTMTGRFNSAAAAGLEAVFQYKLDEGDCYYAAISGGSCVLGKGEHDSPSVVLMMDSQTFKEILAGETNGMQAFMAGRIRADGDIMLATRLEALFPAS